MTRAFDPDAALSRLEAHGHPGAHAADREIGLDSDHGVVRAGHAGVRDERGPSGQHACVRGLDVRVRPDHAR